MIGHARGVQVFAYGEPVDMRKSFDTLSALVEGAMKRKVLTGDVFLFVARNRKRAKVLYFDGTGLCLLAKRLEKGCFARVHPVVGEREVMMTLSELSLFIEGSEAIGRAPLSPPLLRVADLSPRWSREL